MTGKVQDINNTETKMFTKFFFRFDSIDNNDFDNHDNINNHDNFFGSNINDVL